MAQTMTEEDDIDGLAGEYVLGSLDATERRLVDARRRTDASLDAAIVAWERRLGPLNDRARGSPHLHMRSTASCCVSRARRHPTSLPM